MPKFVEKFREMLGDQQGEVRIRPGAGDLYEDRFSYYWLVTMWSVLIFHILAMGVVLVNMSTTALTYQWLPQLAGTAIVDCGIAFMAIVYRFILFPAPSFQSRQLAIEGMPMGGMFGHPQYHQPMQPGFGPPTPRTADEVAATNGAAEPAQGGKPKSAGLSKIGAAA